MYIQTVYSYCLFKYYISVFVKSDEIKGQSGSHKDQIQILVEKQK